MLMGRFLYSKLKNNSYLILGLCAGLFLSLNFASFEENSLCNEAIANPFTSAEPKPSTTDEYEPKLNIRNKPLQPKKVVKNLQRPRYYSTELGIREKLFVGVLTTEQNINLHATAINKTLAHLANKIKFFITANVVKNNLNLSNIVGFTDTREIVKPFHVLKYISDNYLEEYDYFYLISDLGFVNGRRLLEVVNGISVSEDVYMGTIAEPDSHYCSLDAGMLLSNSVVKSMRESLDWCVHNSYSREHHQNIGRCVIHSTQLHCTDTLQGQHLSSYRVPPAWDLQRDLASAIQQGDAFNKAVSVFPVHQHTDFYSLQMYFSRLHLESLHEQIQSLGQQVSVSSSAWPPGARDDPTVPAAPPPDRFHQPRLSPLDHYAALLPDDYSNVQTHSHIDAQDIEYIINAAILKVQSTDPSLKYSSLVNAYKRFDPSRGMSYLLDIKFSDGVTRRLEVCKPLGRASVLAVPYVTESSRVVALLPVWAHQATLAAEFVAHYEQVCLTRKDKTYLLLVLLYGADAPSRGPEDVHAALKTSAHNLAQTYKADGQKLGWVSVRLPPHVGPGSPGLVLALADLALRKVPPESLVLLLRPHAEIKPDFLNRVRMNTIQGYQVFSALGFQRYRPGLASGTAPSKGAGRFAPWDYSVTGFYSRDYVQVRKSIQDKYPIVRSDKDIENITAKAPDDISVFEMFVKFSPELHAFRAVEPGLVFKHDDLMYCPPKDSNKNSTTPTSEEDLGINFGEAILTEKCLNNLAKDNFASMTVGSRSQLAKLIFEAKDNLLQSPA